MGARPPFGYLSIYHQRAWGRALPLRGRAGRARQSKQRDARTMSLRVVRR